MIVESLAQLCCDNTGGNVDPSWGNCTWFNCSNLPSRIYDAMPRLLQACAKEGLNPCSESVSVLVEAFEKRWLDDMLYFCKCTHQTIGYEDALEGIGIKTSAQVAAQNNPFALILTIAVIASTAFAVGYLLNNTLRAK